MLPQNMSLVRIMGIDGVMPEFMTQGLEARIEALARGQGVDRKEVEGLLRAEELFKGFDPNAAPGTQLEIFNINWVAAAPHMKSFELGDLFDDRAGALRWFNEELKALKFKPYDEEVFWAAIEKYFSMRHIRKRQATDFFLEFYYEVGKHWKDWFDIKENLTEPQMEKMVQIAVGKNMIDKKRGEKVKTRLLGNKVVRPIKQTAYFAYKSAIEFIKPGYIAGSILDFFKTLFGYLTSNR